MTWDFTMRYLATPRWQHMGWVPRDRGLQRRDESLAKSGREGGLQKEETGIDSNNRLLLEIEIAY